MEKKGSKLQSKFAIFKICFLILVTFFSAANAGELYQWVDQNGVKRFSDSPTDRDALIKNNAKSSPSFEQNTSLTGQEPSGIQENVLSRQAREAEIAEGHGNSIGGGQNKIVNKLGKPDSIGQSNNRDHGVTSYPENIAGSNEKIANDRSAPVVTKDVGIRNSDFVKASQQNEGPNQKIRENNTKATLDNQQRKREIEEYNAKVIESKTKAAEIAKKNREVEEYNAKVRKHNEQIKRQQYEDEKNRNSEEMQNRNKPINRDFGRKPYIDGDYHQMMRK